MSTQIIVLAGGLGKRMGGNVPKALVPLRGKPLISYLLQAIQNAAVCERPVIVVGKGADLLKKTLGESYNYIFQEERLGTGHAVKICKPYLQKKSEHILVLYGDHPFVSSETIRSLDEEHRKSHAAMSLMTVTVPDFSGWHASFYSFGRILRDARGKIFGIRELKDSNEREKEIREVNPSFFCFESEWLWENIEKLNNNNAQKEYYLTDLLGMAIAQNRNIVSIPIEPLLALGINTPEELGFAETLMQ